MEGIENGLLETKSQGRTDSLDSFLKSVRSQERSPLTSSSRGVALMILEVWTFSLWD